MAKANRLLTTAKTAATPKAPAPATATPRPAPPGESPQAKPKRAANEATSLQHPCLTRTHPPAGNNNGGPAAQNENGGGPLFPPTAFNGNGAPIPVPSFPALLAAFAAVEDLAAAQLQLQALGNTPDAPLAGLGADLSPTQLQIEASVLGLNLGLSLELAALQGLGTMPVAATLLQLVSQQLATLPPPARQSLDRLLNQELVLVAAAPPFASPILPGPFTPGQPEQPAAPGNGGRAPGGANRLLGENPALSAATLAFEQAALAQLSSTARALAQAAVQGAPARQYWSSLADQAQTLQTRLAAQAPGAPLSMANFMSQLASIFHVNLRLTERQKNTNLPPKRFGATSRRMRNRGGNVATRKRRGGKAAFVTAASCVLLLGALPLRAGTLPGLDAEDDGVTVPQGHKEAYEAAKEQMKEAPQEKHASGSWFLAGFMGTGFPQTDNGHAFYPNNNPVYEGVNFQFSQNNNFSFFGGLQGGYYWHDPDKWGNLSFSAEAFGAYLGSSVNSQLGAHSIKGAALNLGLLGLGGTIGYRIAKSWEPYIGFYGGGVIGNVAYNAFSNGDVWGYWFAPAVGFRYFIPNSHWFLAIQGMFLFINDLNGFRSFQGEIADLNHGGGYMYAPVGALTIGYAF